MTSLEREIQVLNAVIATPSATGGAVRAGLKLGDNLDDYLSVDNVKMEGKKDDDLIQELNLKNNVFSLPSKTILRDTFKKIIDYPNNYSNILIWTELDLPRSLDEYNVVHLHNPIPLGGLAVFAFKCRRLGIPYCVTTHGVSKVPEMPKTFGGPANGAIQSLLFKTFFLKPYFHILENADHLFALSENDKEIIKGLFPDQSVSVVPNGVDLNPPTQEADEVVEEYFEVSASEPLLLYVGKLLESKGVEDLLEAFPLVEKRCSLILAGPSLDKRLKEKIQKSSGQVQYVGYIDKDLLDLLYQRADIFVFPTRSDVFPLSNLEAMASKTPVISTNVGGIPEQLKDGGILVPPSSPDKVAEALNYLIENEDSRKKMGHRAFMRAEKEFSWKSVAREIAKIYDENFSR